ncbi:MAG: porin [Alphaproteobacteria bacterium]|nr:porin [Alphaproteobacteria bacterium]
MTFRHSWTLITLAGSVAVAGPAVAQDLNVLEKRVEALEKAGRGQTVQRSKKSMSLTVSGHVNRAIQFRDNGSESGVLHVTNNLSRTRVRWVGEGKINDDLTAGTLIELGNQSAISSRQDLGDNANADAASALDERRIEFTITSKRLGQLTVGQGDTASEDTADVDLSGTGIATLSGDPVLLAGSEAFQLNNAAQGRTVGNVFSSFDGAGRRDRIRYDTPAFAGFTVAVAHHNADRWDAGLHYGATFGGVKVAAGLGYADDASRNFNKTFVGSLSVLLPMGLSVSVGGETHGKIGYRFNRFPLGETRLAVEYSEVNDGAGVNEKARYYGAAAVQVIEPLGAELYLSYHNFSLDVGAGADPDDIDVVTAGARFKF